MSKASSPAGGGRAGLLAGAVAFLLVALSVVALLRGEEGVTRERDRVGDTPVTVLRGAPARGPAPVVVVAHGFAGSQRLMDPLALALAARGYVVVTFDFLGHGRHSRPMTGDLGVQEGAAAVLAAQTREVADWALALPGVDGRLATAGHSMATNILVLHAQADPRVQAMVGISTFAPTIEPGSPPNLLFITGALEGRLESEARRVMALTTGEEAEAVEPFRTYGSLGDGSARRLAVAPRVEHVGVLYSATTLRESADWLDAAFGRPLPPEGTPVRGTGRGLWILLLLGGVLVLARSLAPFLPGVAPPGRSSPPSWRRLTRLAGIPALVTPLVLALVPTGFLPVIVADYLAVHFALFGLLGAALLWREAGRPGLAEILARAGLSAGGGWRVAGLTLLTVGFFLLFVAWPFERFFTAFLPLDARFPLFLAALAGTLPYFLFDEWLTRAAGGRRGGYAWTKVLFLLSLGLAVALDFQALFFLLIIVPLVVAFFVIHGMLSGWIVRGTGSPVVAGVTNAVALAWALAVTFPLYAGP